MASNRREPQRLPRSPIPWARVAGWFAFAIGVALFVSSFIASSAGAVILPFDPHHFIGEAGGLVLAVSGISFATRPQ